jgi:hypothetical protein
MEDDQDLRARFASLRDGADVRAPDLDAILQRRPAARRPPSRALAFTSGVLCLMVTAGLLHRMNRVHAPVLDVANPSILSWRAPTDFLLETPGRALLSTVPKIGEMPGPVPAPSEHGQPISMQGIDSSETLS